MKKVLIAGIRKTKLDRFHTWLHDEYQVMRARDADELKRFCSRQDLIVIDEIGDRGGIVVKDLSLSGQTILVTTPVLAGNGIPEITWPFTEQQFLDKVRSLLENQP
ncbi:MAG: hypothetical protein WDN47_04245 [Candidatus Doudnabacteria bacterium]